MPALRTIAFPAISTGAYRFPKEEAAVIAIRETVAALLENAVLEKVLFVCFDANTRKAYEKALIKPD